MWSSLLIELAFILVLILANGIFAAAEIAVVSARKGRLEQAAARGQQGATVALELADNPNHFLSTVQVGITLIGTLAAVFGGARLADVFTDGLRTIPALAPYAQSIALAVVVVLISYISLIVGELVPKRLALQSAERIAIRLAPAMRFLGRLTDPVVRFLSFSSELVLRLLGRHDVEETPITEDDVMALVREGTADGTLEAAEAHLISSVFTFTERSVRSLMTPRTQVVAVEVSRPFAEMVQVVTASGFSRIPVYQGTLDNIVGILHVRDLLRALGQAPPADVRSLVRPPIYIPEAQRAVIAFQQLKHQRSGLAMVVDEWSIQPWPPGSCLPATSGAPTGWIRTTGRPASWAANCASDMTRQRGCSKTSANPQLRATCTASRRASARSWTSVATPVTTRSGNWTWT